MKISTKFKYTLIFLLGALSFWAYNKYAFPTVDSKIRPNKEKSIAIIGAMDEEVEIIKSNMLLDTIISKAGIDFHLGKIGTRKVVVLKSGIAKVNAAMATQICIDEFSASQIINSGVAGALSSRINLGDILVASTLEYHDVDITAFGFKPGVISRMDTSTFYSNRSMMASIIDIADKKNIKTKIGKIVTGDQFIESESKKEFITEHFNADAVDMESAAIAHVAYLNDVPFVVVRSISDNADGSSPVDYMEFKKKAAEKSAALIISYLEIL